MDTKIETPETADATEAEVSITITVPPELADFIGAAVQSGSYMWVITHPDPVKPGVFKHARTLRGFPIPEILGSLEKHKEEFTEKVIKPSKQMATTTMVDDPTDPQTEKQGLKVIDIPAPGMPQTASQDTGKPDIKEAREEYTGWE